MKTTALIVILVLWLTLTILTGYWITVFIGSIRLINHITISDYVGCYMLPLVAYGYLAIFLIGRLDEYFWRRRTKKK